MPTEGGLKDHVTRAESYLRRVRHLHLTFPTMREYTLWQMLLMLGVNRPYICPNLEKITLTLSGDESLDSAYRMFTLVSPTITAVSWLTGPRDDHEQIGSALLDALRLCGAHLIEVSYEGYASKRILDRLCHFPTLRSVSITPNQILSSRNQDSNPPFYDLVHLTTLNTHLSIHHPKRLGWSLRSSNNSLSNLRLSGTWDLLNWCLTYASHGPTILQFVRILTLIFDFPEVPEVHFRISSNFFFNHIPYLFPGIRELHIQILNQYSMDSTNPFFGHKISRESTHRNFGPPICPPLDLD
ncbi:hypothetical protein P691DRAFT_760295 [Macrolepiota fuliginosa MF-IS2]|uniref:Uncharacterized protein n=1 Tax=Macrolepiota fuliginosa MF-IS2 TaxID=1400762 RepID=A0A9P5XAX3_9AGAR|nr:hypothetical protein P691DRAFT_760295 [Macrolepiota fuliginosa MF-IS2]